MFHVTFVTLLEVPLMLMKGQSIAGFFHYALNSSSNYSFILLKLGWFCLKQFFNLSGFNLAH